MTPHTSKRPGSSQGDRRFAPGGRDSFLSETLPEFAGTAGPPGRANDGSWRETCVSRTDRILERGTAESVGGCIARTSARGSGCQGSRQNQIAAQRIGLGLLLLGILGAVAGVLAGFGMARSVHRSLVEISVPVRDIAGRLNEVVGPIKVASDTELAELDGALRLLADKTADVVQRLQESQREMLRHEQLAAVGQLAAGLAHELRNPLMSVKLIVQTAEERANGALNTARL